MKSLKGIFHHCQVKLVAQSAPRTLLQVSGTAWAALPCLYFAVKKHWTWCFLSSLLTWKFRNGFNLGYFSGWYGYMISTVPSYAVFHTQTCLLSHVQMYILKFFKKHGLTSLIHSRIVFPTS